MKMKPRNQNKREIKVAKKLNRVGDADSCFSRHSTRTKSN